MTYEDIIKIKRDQQESDRKALLEDKLKQEDLSLFRGFDRSKVSIVRNK